MYTSHDTEMKTQAVNTVLTPSLPSVPTFATTEWSSMYGGEEDKMEELLQEVLVAFPTRTTESKLINVHVVQ